MHINSAIQKEDPLKKLRYIMGSFNKIGIKMKSYSVYVKQNQNTKDLN